MSLIGIAGWDPTGESMWSIMRRVANKNHLTWAEVRLRFGTRNYQSYTPAGSVTFDDHKQFNVVAFAKLVGWNPDTLRASFSPAYKPPWAEDNYDAGNGRAHNRLRICPSCIDTGTHLAVHQLVNWHKCPIHDESLTSRCPSCDSPISYYNVSKYFWQQSKCHKCDAPLFGDRQPTPKEQEQRVAFVREYADWMQSQELACDEKSSPFTWLGTAQSVQHLIATKLAQPTPRWIDSLDGPHVSRLTTWTWDGPPVDPGTSAHAHRLSTDPIKIMYGNECHRVRPPRIVEDFARFLSLGVQARYADLWEQFGGRRRAGVYEMSSKECTPQWGEHIDSWATAMWFWRRSMDESFPMRSRVARRRDHLSVYMGAVWEKWVTTVGQLLWSPFRNLIHPRNAAFVRWLTRLWLRRFLDEAYCRFVGVASRAIGADWLNSHWLISELDAVAPGSYWVLERGEDGRTRVHAVSRVAPMSEFVQLQESGFNINGPEYCDSFERQNPLIELLGSSAQQIEGWKCHWETVRDYNKNKRERAA